MIEQTNLFGTKRMQMDESIAMTAASMNAYGPDHDTWVFAWSGGKDSTTTLTLILWMIESKMIAAPKRIIVMYADTRMELTPLSVAAHQIIEELKEREVDVRIVMAGLDDRFLVYMLGRGVPPPSNRFRWCTGKIKIEPMEKELRKVVGEFEKALVITGVRTGESAVRDERIRTSCNSKDAECGQGWYQNDLQSDKVATLAPILHWRVCHVWEWLKHWAPDVKYGDWSTRMIADAYGGDEAEEINSRTGCIGCPLVETDTGLANVIKIPTWKYLAPLKRLKVLYREMRLPKYRLRKTGWQKKKDGSLSKNQNRMGPLTLEARSYFLDQILSLQEEINISAKELFRPIVDIINSEEEARIRELINLKTFPERWDGDEQTGDMVFDQYFQDGTIQPRLFY